MSGHLTKNVRPSVLTMCPRNFTQIDLGNFSIGVWASFCRLNRIDSPNFGQNTALQRQKVRNFNKCHVRPLQKKGTALNFDHVRVRFHTIHALCRKFGAMGSILPFKWKRYRKYCVKYGSSKVKLSNQVKFQCPSLK